ncbi:hypothetical protein EYC59_01645 [Candidatus Saccharibacteria bacterium]|nr:MAG: hypothetical protein EYC59_01645 [Candidatus Saccharibacteria bacterium]
MNETQTPIKGLDQAPADPEAAKINEQAQETRNVAEMALKLVMKDGVLMTPKEVEDTVERQALDIH